MQYEDNMKRESRPYKALMIWENFIFGAGTQQNRYVQWTKVNQFNSWFIIQSIIKTKVNLWNMIRIEKVTKFMLKENDGDLITKTKI